MALIIFMKLNPMGLRPMSHRKISQSYYSHVCPECDQGYLCKDEKLYDGVYLLEYTCGTKLHKVKRGNAWTKKWEFCKQKLKGI